MFGKVVIDHEGVAPRIHKLLTYGTASVGSDVLKCRWFRCRRRYHYSVVESPVLIQCGNDLTHLGALLPDGDIDAYQVFVLLVDDCVYGDGRLACLPVTDYQLSLTPSNGDHRVDGLDTGLNRRVNVLASDYTRCNVLDGSIVACVYGTLAVDGTTQRVNHSSQEPIPYRDGDDAASPAYNISLLNIGVPTHNDNADTIRLQVKGHSDRP